MLGYVSQEGVNYLILALALLTFAGKVWALVDAAIRPAPLFVAAGKQTKRLWLALLGVAVVVQLAIASPLFLLNLVGIGLAIFYLVDVRPALQQLGGGRGRRHRGGPTGW